MKKRSRKPLAHCCADMKRNVEHKCEQHPDRFECPDNLIFHSNKSGYGIIVHDGGGSSIKIGFCPWCGAKLADVNP